MTEIDLLEAREAELWMELRAIREAIRHAKQDQVAAGMTTAHICGDCEGGCDKCPDGFSR